MQYRKKSETVIDLVVSWASFIGLLSSIYNVDGVSAILFLVIGMTTVPDIKDVIRYYLDKSDYDD